MIRHSRWPNRRGGAFTLLELIVIAVILVLLVGASIPAFNAILANTTASLADSSLRIGLANGREAAIRSENRTDSAAVFFFEPNGRVTIIACREVGQLRTRRGDRVVPVSVFVPDPFYDPVTLPSNWHAKGYAPAGSITTAGDSQPYRWYSTDRYQSNRPNWVFPETNFYDDGSTVQGNDGFARQTFMIRFEGGSGSLSPVRGDALIFDPIPQTGFRQSGIWSQYRADRVADRARFVRQLLALDLSEAQLEDLIGDRSIDTVLARPVRQVALYDVRQLAGEVGVSLNNTGTGSLYNRPQGRRPDFNFAAQVNESIDEVAEFFTIERQTGQIVRLPETED